MKVKLLRILAMILCLFLLQIDFVLKLVVNSCLGHLWKQFFLDSILFVNICRAFKQSMFSLSLVYLLFPLMNL